MKVTDSLFTVTNITQLLCYYEDLGPPSGVFPSGFPTNTLHATSIVYLIMYLPTIILWTVQYKTWHSSLDNSVQSRVTYSLIGPNISLSTVLSRVLPIMWETQSFTLTFLHSKCKYIWLPLSLYKETQWLLIQVPLRDMALCCHMCSSQCPESISSATLGYGTMLPHEQFPIFWHSHATPHCHIPDLNPRKQHCHNLKCHIFVVSCHFFLPDFILTSVCHLTQVATSKI